MNGNFAVFMQLKIDNNLFLIHNHLKQKTELTKIRLPFHENYPILVTEKNRRHMNFATKISAVIIFDQFFI